MTRSSVPRDLAPLLNAVRDGAGVAYMIEDQVEAEITSGRLVRVLEDG